MVQRKFKDAKEFISMYTKYDRMIKGVFKEMFK